MARSWPRPRHIVPSHASIAPDQSVNDHNIIPTTKSLREKQQAPSAHEKYSQSQAILLNSDELQASEQSHQPRDLPQTSQNYVNGFDLNQEDLTQEEQSEQDENEDRATQETFIDYDAEDVNGKTKYLDDDDEDDVHYQAPAPIHRNRYGILEQTEEEDDIEEKEDGEDEDGDEDEDEDDDDDGTDDEDDIAGVATKPESHASSGSEDESSDSSSEESTSDSDEEEEEEEQPRHRRPAPPPSRTWGGKGGTSVEDAIEL